MQAVDQIAMALAQLRRLHTIDLDPVARRFEHQAALLHGDFVPLLIEAGQLFEQVLAAAQADIAGQVGADRVLHLVEYVQQGQRRGQALAGPGGVIADRGGGLRAIDSSHYVGHRVPLG